MREEVAPPDQEVADVAARQHGVVTVAQLARAGIDKAGVTRRVKAGRLHRVHRGVYAVGHPRLTFEGRCLAAVRAYFRGQPACTDPVPGRAVTRAAVALSAAEAPSTPAAPTAAMSASGFIAAVSHRSAAALWGLLPEPRGAIDISLTSRSGRSQHSGTVLHRPPSLCPDDITGRHGVPLTRPVRTLRDLRRTVPPALLQRATRKALDLKLVSDDQLRNDDHLTRSELERLFLRLCGRHHLPRPEVNVGVGGFEVDFLWREQHLIVETDGFRHHSNRLAFERDRARDVRLQALGFRVLRFTYRQVKNSPAVVASSVRDLLHGAGRAIA